MQHEPIHDAGTIRLGPARFTVITPECIRLEYSETETFVDQPTLFAVNRNARCDDFTWGMDGDSLWIDTKCIRLIYTPDGCAFRDANKNGRWDANLRAEITHGDDRVMWTLRKKNERNLGGTTKTLDGFNGEGGVGEGLLSRDGWFLVDDARRKHGAPATHVFEDGWIAQRSWDKDQDFYLFGYGTDYKAALRALFTIGGPVPMIRKYVLGSWYCRWWDYTSDEYRELVKEYHDHDFPLDVMVMDMGWHRYGGTNGYGWAGNLGWTGFSWNRDLLPDVEELLQELHGEGLHTALNVHPHDGIRNHEDMYPDFMKELGHDPDKQENLLFDAGDKAYMDAYFKHGHTPHEEMGVDFWWVDWQQDALFPYVTRIPYLEHLPWLNHLYYEHSRASGQRGLSYSRWGGWGDHRHPIHFSGDTGGNWDVLAWEVPFTAVSGNVGCFYWAHDTGGFFGGRDAQLFTRWVQFSAAGASLRLHSMRDKDLDRRPWMWGDRYESAMRTSYHLRSQLMPYVYTSTWPCHTQGLPLVRPLYLEWPTVEDAYENPQEYMLGDAILVAPIARPGVGPEHVALQKVWFPEGRWYNTFSGERFDGPVTETVAATLEEFPLFVQGGVPLPMQPYTERMGTAHLDHLVIRLYPGETGKPQITILYEDDGLTEAHEKGESAQTGLTAQWSEEGVLLKVDATVGTFAGQPQERAIMIELPATERATAIDAGDLAPTHTYDKETCTNVINLPYQSIRDEITVTVEVKEVDPGRPRLAAFKTRVAGILGHEVTASSWEEALSLAKQEDLPDEVMETLAVLSGKRKITVQEAIPVGKPFSDPDW